MWWTQPRPTRVLASCSCALPQGPQHVTSAMSSLEEVRDIALERKVRQVDDARVEVEGATTASHDARVFASRLVVVGQDDNVVNTGLQQLPRVAVTPLPGSTGI